MRVLLLENFPYSLAGGFVRKSDIFTEIWRINGISRIKTLFYKTPNMSVLVHVR